MSLSFVAPVWGAKAFNCPHCTAFAQQMWRTLSMVDAQTYMSFDSGRWSCAQCVSCCAFSIWQVSTLIYPGLSSAPIPNPHLPENVLLDYNEARDILAKSPRGAAALLRLALQKLCAALGEKGKNINDDITSLVAKGLPSRVQQALDTVRVIGNEAVHPGQIDLNDNPEIANSLFGLLNFVADKMIGEPAEIDRLYGLVPDNKKRSV